MIPVRDALNVARYDWFGLRIGGRGASMRGLWPALIVASALIFGCFFVLGRMTAGGAPAPETSSAQRVAHAAIPGGLHGGSPVAGDVPSAIVTPPVRRAPASTALPQTPASQPAADTTSGASAPSVSQPASAPVPAQASAPPPKSPSSGSAGEPSSGGGAGGKSSGGSADAPSSGGGAGGKSSGGSESGGSSAGSFDSSG
jgi:hypothetical protein